MKNQLHVGMKADLSFNLRHFWPMKSFRRQRFQRKTDCFFQISDTVQIKADVNHFVGKLLLISTNQRHLIIKIWPISKFFGFITNFYLTIFLCICHSFYENQHQGVSKAIQTTIKKACSCKCRQNFALPSLTKVLALEFWFVT